MKIVLISPPDERPNEIAIVETLFAAGLERYHLRKPGWKSAQVALWLESMPARWRGRIVLHSHSRVGSGLALPDANHRGKVWKPSQGFHFDDLAACFRVGGIHFRDDGNAPEDPTPRVPSGCLTSRSCHDVAAVKAALGRYDSIFFGPVFPSLSKPGYGPAPKHVLDALGSVLATRGSVEKRTKIFAIGGVTAQRLHDCHTLGFDGVAILGAVWNAADPVAAFLQFQSASCRGAGAATDDKGSLQ
jgi:thiamine-phosphate pyrophosphorylase